MASQTFRLDVSARERVMTLSGDLTDTPSARELIASQLGKVAASKGKWRIVAHEARVLPTGAEMWIEYALQSLADCELKYEFSQLALVLLYDDEYREKHRNSTFEEQPTGIQAAEDTAGATTLW
ncbi:MAG: hypothetical protein K2Y37_01310 [Pirellulales bacterium]|nr:hypothetical protein [Pirellulales bacterium]